MCLGIADRVLVSIHCFSVFSLTIGDGGGVPDLTTMSGIPNVLEADLARDSMVGPLLLEAEALLSCSLEAQRILRNLSISVRDL